MIYQSRSYSYCSHWFSIVLISLGITSWISPCQAQESEEPTFQSLGGKFGGLGNFGSFGGTGANSYSLDATYTVEDGTTRGRVRVTATLGEGYAMYSVTQPTGGPLRTVIKLTSPTAKLDGPFVPDKPPKSSLNERGFEGVTVEKHLDEVTWTAPISFDKPLGKEPADLELTVDGQVCKGACITIDEEPVIAKFDGFYRGESSAAPMAKFLDPKARTTWTIQTSRTSVRPGETIDLVLRSSTSNNYHIYVVRPEDPETNSSTIILLSEKGPFLAGKPLPDSPAIHREMIPGVLAIDYHEADVAWRIPIQVPQDAQEGSYTIEGLIGYQACDENNCEEPLGLKFSGQIQVAQTPIDSSAPFSIESFPYQKVKTHPKRLQWFDAIGPSASEPTKISASVPQPIALGDLFTKFCLAVLGGFVLNFMPCVLPVIGLKVISFVKESDRSGASIISLNLWYIAGIMTVFLGLAIFTIAFRATQGDAFGWGEQFGSAPLRIGLCILMFAMALSFLGVWEIPIPGFAMSQTSSELMQREGPVGAYSKGLLTTILATPCSGPGLAAAFAVAVAQPAWVIILMYVGVGLGMSLPFIVVCVSPDIVKHIPKPGPWMQSFKEFLAFPMLFALVWLFLTTFTGETLIAVIMTLFGVWFACWWIGRVPAWSNKGTKTLHWTGAIAVASLIGLAAFKVYGDHAKLIAWVPYSQSQLDALESQQKTVMIDFTAQWCANCKYNLLTAIETKKVADLIDSKGIVPMLADFTDRPREIKQKLHELQSNSIPILAIYPAGSYDKPIVLRDVVTQGMVLKALRQATETPAVSAQEPNDRSFPISVSRQAPP